MYVKGVNVMAEYLAPGVYVEEFDSGVKAMEGVGTSTAGFIGMAVRGPTRGKPRLVTNVTDFHKKFGGYLGEEYGEHRFLSYAVEQFFANGGSRCYIMRVASDNQMSATVDIENVLRFTATSSGNWGNAIKIQIRKTYQAKTFVTRKANEDEEKKNQYVVKSSYGFYSGDVIEFNEKLYTVINVFDNILELNKPLEGNYFKDETHPHAFLQSVVMDIHVIYENFEEVYENCSLNPSSPSFVVNALEKSDFIQVSLIETTDKKVDNEVFYTKYTTELQPYLLTGGTTIMPLVDYADMYIGKDNGPSQRSGIQAFIEMNDVSIMAVPGITSEAIQSALITHCEMTGSRFAILDAPFNATTIDQLLWHRDQYNTTYAAIYHPWLLAFDPLLKKNSYTPPSGAMAGIYARVDNTRGVWKAPANEVVRNVIGLSVNYNEADQGKLNPKGVNLIRSLPGMGIRVWGARTCSSDSNWKYVNVRRLFIYIEESIKANTSWAVFEPNDENLWSRVSGTIHVFLTTLWRDGALAGSSADEAFFVNVGRTTMTQDDISNGRLICVIGVAPVRPAEFIIFRITQKIQDAS